MQNNGAERAFAAFNNQKGKFVRKDLYVFVIDDKGVYHASGAAPEALVGLNVLDTTDAAGNPLFRQMIDATRQADEATVRYMWLNRVTNKIEPKVSYVRKIGHYVLGVGYSAPRASAEDARAMLQRAVAFAQAQGPDKAAAAFNDRSGEFVKDDLYVFMVDLASGRFQAMGMNPALSGTDAIGLHDAAGHALVAEMVEKLKSADEASVEYVWRNPVTNAVEKKRSYVRKVGGSLIGVGHYLE
jgi:cytochrome c